jgi:hypothetical protein
MRNIYLHTWLKEDGTREAYRVSESNGKLSPYHPDDRVEDGVFLTAQEFESYRLAKETVEAMALLGADRDTVGERVKAAERNAFEAAYSRNWMNACGDRLEPDEWENAYELWIEERQWLRR